MQWYEGNVESAVADCKTKGAMLLVYVKGTDSSSEEMDKTWDHSDVSHKFETVPTICLQLTLDSVAGQQFSSIFPVSELPTTYFIRSNGQVALIIRGACSKEELLEKTALALDQNTSPASGPAAVRTGPVAASESSPNVDTTTESNVNAELAAPDSGASSELAASISSSAYAGAQTETGDEANEGVDEKQAKVERARELIRLKQAKKAAEEKEKALIAETERRQLGKDLDKLKQLKAEQEAKETRDALRKDKEEARIAREKIREQIQKDREARHAKYQQEKTEKEEALRRREQEKLAQEAEEAARIATLNSFNARIQFRMPDGSRISHTFESDQALQSAVNLIATHESNSLGGNFRLATIYPRRVFTSSEYPKTFRELSLVPTSALLVLPPAQGGDGARSSSSLTSSATSLLSMLFSPLFWVWGLVQSFIFARPQQPPVAQPTDKSDEPTAEASRPTSTDTNRARRRVGRLTDLPPEDDDQNTWNGNSTQQM
ncbi:UBX domain-containing protein 4-like [Watersipora subatra]|uniref:UBX domain-containing protein 4-like n=1 Tax=Watersipora subatra TaxID=2589382 RepID=UPI00355C6579